MAALSLNKLISHVRGSDLPYEDGVPLESSWHLDAMYLLITILRYFWRDRTDIYIGGNMFVYFDPDQDKTRNFRGPDFFVVKGVTDNSPRKSWVVWEEAGLAPDFVIELASPSTLNFDVTGKKEVYEQILATPEYIVYNPATEELWGWRLSAGRYLPIEPNEQGWLWCDELGLWLGVVDHKFVEQTSPVKVLRFFDETGRLLPTPAEAEAETRRRAEHIAETAEARAKAAEHMAETIEARAKVAEQRAETAEAEIARLKALLAERDPDHD